MTSQIENPDITPEREKHKPIYVVYVDGVDYTFDHSPVTGGEIMDAAGIPYEVGLIQIFEDGTQKQVGVDEEIRLRPGQLFKRKPKFKRG